MTNPIRLGAGLMILSLLGACADGVYPYRQGPDTVIANADDSGRDTGALVEGRAAIAYTPDGCQNWILDDGVEGYADNRYDPVSGLPICNGQYAPGTVLRSYQTGSQGITDFVPVRRRP